MLEKSAVEFIVDVVVRRAFGMGDFETLGRFDK
jgi:hypothetical protein